MNNPTFRAETFAAEVPAQYRPPDRYWHHFLLWWKRRWPNRPLPCRHGLHNIMALTGLLSAHVERLLQEETPTCMLPKPPKSRF